MRPITIFCGPFDFKSQGIQVPISFQSVGVNPHRHGIQFIDNRRVNSIKKNWIHAHGVSQPLVGEDQ